MAVQVAEPHCTYTEPSLWGTPQTEQPRAVPLGYLLIRPLLPPLLVQYRSASSWLVLTESAPVSSFGSTQSISARLCELADDSIQPAYSVVCPFEQLVERPHCT